MRRRPVWRVVEKRVVYHTGEIGNLRSRNLLDLSVKNSSVFLVGGGERIGRKPRMLRFIFLFLWNSCLPEIALILVN